MFVVARWPSTSFWPGFDNTAVEFTAKGQFIIDDELLSGAKVGTLPSDCLARLRFAELEISGFPFCSALVERFALTP